MFQRILVIMLLMMVEFSVMKECFSSYKQNTEIQDLEDNNESEDSSKEIMIEKYFITNTCFQFNSINILLKSSICDAIASSITNPFKVIDSPPPKA